MSTYTPRHTATPKPSSTAKNLAKATVPVALFAGASGMMAVPAQAAEFNYVGYQQQVASPQWNWGNWWGGWRSETRYVQLPSVGVGFNSQWDSFTYPYKEGQVIRATLTYTNTNTYAVNVSPNLDIYKPQNAGSCDVQNLAPGAQFSCTIEHTLTSADIASGRISAGGTLHVAQSGDTSFSYDMPVSMSVYLYGK